MWTTIATQSTRAGRRLAWKQPTLPSGSVGRMIAWRSFSATTSPEDFISQQIDNNPVAIFSKSFCPFCARTKATFRDLNVDAAIIEMNQRDDGAELQQALLDRTGQRTVPNVFVHGQHVGGNEETQAALASGKLEEMLSQKQ